MASTALLCYEPLLGYLKDYYVILAEVDGHSDNLGELDSLADNCTEIEAFILEKLRGELYCLCGFSMGGTMAVEIVGRGNVRISKVLLDAAFLTKMGFLTKLYEKLFCKGISRMQQGKKIPKLEVVEFDNMGHGQYLHEHSAEYATKFIEYLEA